MMKIWDSAAELPQQTAHEQSAAISLPSDYPRVAVKGVHCTEFQFEFPEQFSDTLITFSKQKNIPLNILLYTAFMVLIYRYTDQEKIISGSLNPIADENLLGEIQEFFKKPLIIEADFSGQPTFQDLLIKIEAELNAAGELPGLEPPTRADAEFGSDHDHTTNLQVFFDFRGRSQGAATYSRVDIQNLITIADQRKNFDLALLMQENQGDLGGYLVYNQNLFTSQTITRMVDHYQVLLNAARSQLSTQISLLPILTPEERDQILVGLNATHADIPKNATIINLFDAQVEKSPDAIALVDGNINLTYQQLNQKANQLAHFLLSKGVGPEIKVGICMHRSSEIIISLLGILKAGGSYLPLDPVYPAERLAYMLEDASPRLVLTQSRLENIFSNPQPEIIALDTHRVKIADLSTENPSASVEANDLAYIIYTSGSTGKPKGVMVEHRSLLNFCLQAVHEYEIGSGDRVLQFASLSFDASVEEIFPCLLSGATLVLRSDSMIGSMKAFFQFCHDLELTVLDLPTSFWHNLVSELPSLKNIFPEQVRLVIIGGEKAELGVVVEWFKYVPRAVRLINTYGPTEATVVATTFTLSHLDGLHTVPIGKPLGNVQAYILGKQLEPVPVGVPGELHLGGVGLARGYLNQPDLTAEKFITNIFNLQVGERLYKTGDLVRYLPDGNIEFLGRVDNQVKIRGFRIELGEVEAAIREYPGVKDVAVFARNDHLGNKQLVAYLVLNQEQFQQKHSWRKYLGDRLPHFMIPAAFVHLDKFPISPSGKIDLQSLPEPILDRDSLEQDYIAPSTKVEKILADIWSQVLKHADIGIHDNFFDLGGDSILGIQITSRASQSGILLGPNQILECQTIAKLAEAAGTGPAILADQEMVSGILPLTPFQINLLTQNLPDINDLTQTLLLRVQDPLEKQALLKAAQALLIHHDALRTRFFEHDSTWHQEIAPPGKPAPFSYSNLNSDREMDQIHILQKQVKDLQANLNLFSGPAMQLAYFDFGQYAESYMLFTFHPLAVDNYSWGIFLEHFELAYQQLKEGREVHLPSKTTSVKHWVHRIAEYANSDSVRREVPYWLTLQDLEAASIPLDVLDSSEATGSRAANLVRVSLGAQATQALLHDVPKAYKTLITDVLLAALQATMSRWTGNDKLLVEIKGHGREAVFADIDLSGTIGCFTIRAPIILTASSVSGPGERLMEIKEQLHNIPSGGLGYGALCYLNQDEEVRLAMEKLPQPQIGFEYVGNFDSMLDSSMIFKTIENIEISTFKTRDNKNHLMEILTSIQAGQLQIEWVFPQDAFRLETIEQLANSFLDHLEEIIEHCKNLTNVRYTPSDFPEANLTQQELDDLLAEISDYED